MNLRLKDDERLCDKTVRSQDQSDGRESGKKRLKNKIYHDILQRMAYLVGSTYVGVIRNR